MTATIEEILGGIQLPKLSARIITRGDLLGETTRLANEYEATRTADEFGPANSPGESERQRLWDRLQELEREVQDSAVVFEFQALSSTAYKKLREAFPPTDEDRQLGLDFDSERFPQALLAACCVAPKMTVEQVETLLDSIHEGEFTKLWNTAMAVNLAEVTAPKFVKRSAAEALSATSSNIAAVTASPEASSSDG